MMRQMCLVISHFNFPGAKLSHASRSPKQRVSSDLLTTALGLRADTQLEVLAFLLESCYWTRILINLRYVQPRLQSSGKKRPLGM